MISNSPGNNIIREAAHHSMQWKTGLFSHVNLIPFLLPLSFVGSVVAFDTKCLGALEKVSNWLISQILDIHGVDFCFKHSKSFEII